LRRSNLATRVVIAALACWAALVPARGASAQPRAATDAGSGFQISGGIEWMGGASVGTVNANEIVASGGAFPLFKVTNELGGAVGVNARIGKRVWRAFELEASASYSRPELRSTTTGDVESAPDLTATDRLRQITVEGAVLFSTPRWRIGRATPFVSGGGGYLRQLHEGDTLAQDGQIYAFGGGVRVPLLARNGRPRSLGLRADARAVVRARGAAPDGASHLSPAFSVSVYVGLSR
jgi:hypothetical protein